MIYHTWSLVGYMLGSAMRSCVSGRGMKLKEVYAQYLESPGTKAYSVREAKRMFASFSAVEVRTVLTHGTCLSQPPVSATVEDFCLSLDGYGPEFCCVDLRGGTDCSCLFVRSSDAADTAIPRRWRTILAEVPAPKAARGCLL